jgi:hypothetical protein
MRKLPKFRTSEERVSWMESELVRKWPAYIRADPRGWVDRVASKYADDNGVTILSELILTGAKPVKKIGENGRKSRDTGMLPWNPHLVLMLDRLVARLDAGKRSPVSRTRKKGVASRARTETPGKA